MSILRATSAVRPVRTLAIQRRLASSGNHDNHDHGASDSTQYPKEGFGTPFWRRTALLTVALTGFFTYAPENLFTTSKDGEAPWLTRVLSFYVPKKEEYTVPNANRLELVEKLAENTLLVHSARRADRAPVRYNQPYDQVSPHCIPVGGFPRDRSY